MKHTHFVLEGQMECKAVLYIPGMLPFELSRDTFDENSKNIGLYFKRVFINGQFDDLLPRWLKFINGMVDSDDLPLNVSRELLQKAKVLSIINKRLVRKSLDNFAKAEELQHINQNEENSNNGYTNTNNHPQQLPQHHQQRPNQLFHHQHQLDEHSPHHM